MIKTIVAMRRVIQWTIPGFGLMPPPILPTPWLDGNSELRITGDKHAARVLIGFL
jgi:hypothetical protein